MTLGGAGRVASRRPRRGAGVGPPGPVRRPKGGESGERVTEASPSGPVRRQDPAASRAIVREYSGWVRASAWR